MGDDLNPADESVGQDTLPELLVRWRLRLDPSCIPELPPASRRRRHLSQADVGRLAGYSEKWYWALEKGRQPSVTAKSLDRLAHVLRLSPAERLALYLHATGRPPGSESEPIVDAAAVADDLQVVLAQLASPAYLSDVMWNVIRYNQTWAEWFPWIEHEENIVRWVFLHPEAREQLVNWREDYARLFLAQLRVIVARHPDNGQLQHLMREILSRNDEAREIWEAREAAVPPDGHILRLRLPFHGGDETAVRFTGLVPMRTDQLRLVVLAPPGGL